MALGLIALAVLFLVPWRAVGIVLAFLILVFACSLAVFIPLKEKPKD